MVFSVLSITLHGLYTYITFGARGLNFLVYCNQEVGSTSVEV